jgi:hypothetical protein
MAFTSHSLAKAREYADRMSNKMAKLREHAEEAIGNGIQVTEVGGTAFAFGYANGRWGEDGEVKVLGLPVDLGVGFALTGIAMFGGLGKYGEHGVNIGSGALAAYAYRSGYQLGADAGADDHKPAGAQKRKPVVQPGRPQMNGPAVNVGWDGQGQTYTVHEHA